MCGIAGFYGAEATNRAARMTRTLAHRGPDDEGVWASSTHPLALGNRRLKIIDLSSGGHQPMVSEDRRYALTFNGEIYNYIELRATLERAGHRFRTTSDTEVLLCALMEWGAGALERLNGMYAFALWDDRTGKALVARDRLGIKPLYYAERQGEFCFASEIKAILASSLLRPEINRAALKSYLRLLWVPEPGTLFAGIHKVEPGTYLLWSEREGLKRVRYWDLPRPEPEAWEGAEARASEELLERLQGAADRQMRSDVPVGVFLSGGLDSTGILGLAARRKSQLHSYFVGYEKQDRIEEGAIDEARYAQLAANRFGSVHQEITLNSDVTSLLPKMVRHLEDPVADPAAINCFLICEAARPTSTVLLSGTGADELFGGYRKYVSTRLADEYQRLPAFIRGGLIEPVFDHLPVVVGRTGLRFIRFGKRFLRHANLPVVERFLGYSTYFDAPELGELLDIEDASDPLVGLQDLAEAWHRRDTGDLVDKMMYVDLKYYLPGLNLAYMDKASMAASVEVRVPLLDDDVVDFASRLPGSMKVQGMKTKIVLRDAFEDLVPDSIRKRAKAPFAAPARSWVRRSLAPLLESCLNVETLRSRGLLNPRFVQQMVREHQTGAEDHSLRIWSLLTLELWLREFVDGSGVHDDMKSDSMQTPAIVGNEPIAS